MHRISKGSTSFLEVVSKQLIRHILKIDADKIVESFTNASTEQLLLSSFVKSSPAFYEFA